MARFKEVVNIQPQTVSTGQAQVFQSLGERLDNFSTQQANRVAEKQIATATIQGQQAASQLQPDQSPEFKEETFVGGVAKKAFNIALRSSYVASIDRDLTLDINALKVEHSDNLLMFNDSVEGLLKGVAQSSDPASRQIIMASAANVVDAARLDVQAATIKREMAHADDDLLQANEVSGDESELFAFNGDDLSSSENLAKILNVNQSRMKSGKISDGQRIRLNDDAIQRTRVARNRGEVSRLLQTGTGIEIASQALQALAANPLKGMTLEQNNELVQILNSDITRFITAENRQEVEDQDTLSARQEQASANLSVGVYTGAVDSAEVIKQMKLGNIDQAQGEKLINRLSSQGVGIDSQVLVNEIHQRLADGEDIDSIRMQINNNAGSNLTTATAGELLTTVNEYAGSESVLNQNATKRARRFMTESMKITGILGALTDDAAKKTAISVRSFDERVLAGEDPFIVADDLRDKDSLLQLESTAGRQGFDIKNISNSINALNAATQEKIKNAAGNKTASANIKAGYNRDLKTLQTIQDLQRSQEEFNKNLKEVIQ